MKKLVLIATVIAFSGCASKKKTETPSPNGRTTANTSLEQRLNEYLELNDHMDMDKMMDYIYPKLFTIVPKDEVVKAMKEAMSSKEVKVELDSLKVEKIHPVFEMDSASYAKVDYSMIMRMDFNAAKDSSDKTPVNHSIGTGDYPAPQATLMATLMSEQFGKNNVSVDNATGIITVRANMPMVAVKDSYAKEWCFLNLKDEDPKFSKLFSKEVLDKLASYK